GHRMTQGTSCCGKEWPIVTPRCKPSVKPPKKNEPRNDSSMSRPKESLSGVQMKGSNLVQRHQADTMTCWASNDPLCASVVWSLEAW
ncbi:hypothetical protein HAX54_030441, partial [Datura stramonium]|nr:hypothetical protein [Datura stramonium]